MPFRIRKYVSGDEQPAYDICLKTGDHGKDGEPFYREDPDALGRIYVGPYLKFSPEFALMLEDDLGVCGYALAVYDSREFFDRYEREWRPDLVRQLIDDYGLNAEPTLAGECLAGKFEEDPLVLEFSSVGH